MVANPEVLVAVQGELSEYDVSILDDEDCPVPYAGTEVLTLIVWPGDDRSPLALRDSSAGWLDAQVGTVRLRFGPVDTASWEPGAYAGRLRVGYGLDMVGAYEFRLDVQAQAGTVLAGKTYCSFDDMRTHAPWIDRLQEPSDRAGFAEQRERARAWLDDAILGGYRPDWGWYGRTKDDASFGGTRWGYGLDGDAPPNKWLRDQLDAGYLIVRDWVREATARYAVSLVCDSLLGDERVTAYQVHGIRNLATAHALIASRMAEIDLPDSQGVRNGWADIWVRIGMKSSR